METQYVFVKYSFFFNIIGLNFRHCDLKAYFKVKGEKGSPYNKLLRPVG